jgi:hypothetical protein
VAVKKLIDIQRAGQKGGTERLTVGQKGGTEESGQKGGTERLGQMIRDRTSRIPIARKFLAAIIDDNLSSNQIRRLKIGFANSLRL